MIIFLSIIMAPQNTRCENFKQNIDGLAIVK